MSVVQFEVQLLLSVYSVECMYKWTTLAYQRLFGVAPQDAKPRADSITTDSIGHPHSRVGDSLVAARAPSHPFSAELGTQAEPLPVVMLPFTVVLQAISDRYTSPHITALHHFTLSTVH